MTSEEENCVGVIFPILPQHSQRFFEGRKRVFVKYTNREGLPRRLRLGSKLYLHQSRSNQGIVGEARIVEMLTATPDEVLARFGDDVFLTRSELEDCSGDRKGKRMLVLVLEGMKRYASPLKLEKNITMAGRYMTKKMIKELQSHKPLTSSS
jgi:hypothetical protein